MTNTLKLTGSDNVTNKRKQYFNAYVEICNLNEAVLLFSFAPLHMSSLFMLLQF